MHLWNNAPYIALLLFTYLQDHSYLANFVFVSAGIVKSCGNIVLRHKQIENESYMQVNPTQMIPQEIIFYFISLSTSSFFSLYNVAYFFVFEVNFALALKFIYHPYLEKLKDELSHEITFWPEFLTITFLLALTVTKYRYNHFRREIELFLLQKKYQAETSFFRDTLF